MWPVNTHPLDRSESRIFSYQGEKCPPSQGEELEPCLGAQLTTGVSVTPWGKPPPPDVSQECPAPPPLQDSREQWRWALAGGASLLAGEGLEAALGLGPFPSCPLLPEPQPHTHASWPELSEPLHSSRKCAVVGGRGNVPPPASSQPLMFPTKVPVYPKVSQKKSELYLRNTEKHSKSVNSLCNLVNKHSSLSSATHFLPPGTENK